MGAFPFPAWKGTIASSKGAGMNEPLGYRWQTGEGAGEAHAWFARMGGRPLPVVIDTDTYNEIDDQFALVHALLAPDRLQVQAVYAAPFDNPRSNGPEDGMLRSFDEIHRVLDALQLEDPPPVRHGSRSFLPPSGASVSSAARDDLVERARAASPEEPLAVIALGALTDIASAVLAAPDIADRIVLAWLGGHPYDWPAVDEFNYRQDLPADRAVFSSPLRIAHFPCKNVCEHLRTNRYEIDAHLRGRGPIGDYLAGIFEAFHPPVDPWSKVLWDLGPGAWLIDPSWIPTVPVVRHLPDDEGRWRAQPGREGITRVAVDVARDAVFGDLFARVARRAE
jgi:purine nucleosidase